MHFIVKSNYVNTKIDSNISKNFTCEKYNFFSLADKNKV